MSTQLCSAIHACTTEQTDRDECALGINGCSQICTNTNGSYTCSCYLGYQISSNNRTCVGKHITSKIVRNLQVIVINMQTEMNVLWV